MKIISDATEYALRATVWLAQQPREPQTIRQIAEATRTPPGYLVKALQSLVKAGILDARRGIHGGFTLVRDPAHLSVAEVVNAVDPIERIKACPLGLDSHADCLCPMHKRMDDALAAIEASFAASKISDLIADRIPSASRCEGLVVLNR